MAHATAVLILWVITALPAVAQLRKITISIMGNGCASCIASLPDRLQRVRGVETVTLEDASTVAVTLAAENRVRVEQLRDLIEQDGTRITKSFVQVRGRLALEDGQWVLQMPGVQVRYAIAAPAGVSLTAGTYMIQGAIEALSPRTGPITIQATAIEKH